MLGRKALTAVAVAMFLASTPAAAQSEGGPLLFSDLFRDHAVFQRDRPTPIWGNALPGEVVTLRFAGSIVTARADRSGRWQAELPAHGAGGPYEVVASTPRGARQSISDILIGDVWLCSGQSNMEFPVQGALNSWGEVNNANDSMIRILSVGHDSSFTPVTSFQTPVRWQVVSPASIPDFSAACYFMGKDLRASQKVPIGLIDASWGGTAIDAWRSQEAIEASGTAKTLLPVYRAFARDPSEGNRLWGSLWQNWWVKAPGVQPGDEPWRPDAPGDWKPVPSLTAWESWGDPSLATFDGMLWYRTRVELTAAQAAMPATVSVGWADEVDQSWVNGLPVGNSYGPGNNRTYDIPAGTLKAGTNWIVINVLDTWGAGGLVGDPQLRALNFKDGTTVPLGTQWQYRTAPAGIGSPPRAPWETNAGLSTIYNGMIAPLGRYGLKGVAWYQGESDSSTAAGYSLKLGSMMADWRRQFRTPALPFLIVQLANWGPQVMAPVETGPATVRDEQRRAVEADPNAALVVTLDVGELNELHPADKQSVGHRLARAARSVAYGEAITPSGPRVVGAQRTTAGIQVSFKDVEGNLVTYSGTRPLGFELCGSAAGSCRFVDATVNGNQVILATDDGPSDRVRFCWGDSPTCNLYDRSGLPAGPFEVKVQ